MARSIRLEARQINNVVTEGSLELKMNPDLTKDINLIVPNDEGIYLTGESLEAGDYNVSLLGNSLILLPVNNDEESKGVFKISTYIPLETYTKSPNGYILEIATDRDFTNIIKTIDNNNFNKEFSVTFENGGVFMYARVRTYTDVHVSNVSSITRFKLLESYVNKPEILFPLNNSEEMPWMLQVTLGDYSYIGTNNYCDGLMYEVSTDEDFNTVEFSDQLFRDENEGDIINFNDYVKTFMLDKLKEDTEYFLRVAYIGNVSGRGDWSDTVRFKTFNHPDMKITTNNDNIIVSKINNSSNILLVTSNVNVINLLTIDNKITELDNKDITYNEPSLLNIVVKKVIINKDNEIFIFGMMEFGGSGYIGPLKKQFITKVTDTENKTISLEVAETIKTENIEGNVTMVPYVSKVDFKDSVLYKDKIVVLGTIPHPDENLDHTLTSCYVIDAEFLTIFSFRNFSKDSYLSLDKIALRNNDLVLTGSTVADLGVGIKKQGIVATLTLDDSFSISILNASMFTNYQDSIIGTVANVKNKILASVISSETNFNSSVTSIIEIDELNNIIDEFSLDGNVYINSINNDDEKITMLGNIILDMNNSYDILFSKDFASSDNITNYINLGNGIISINVGNETLLLNSKLDLSTNLISDLGITKTYSNDINKAVPTLTNVTHEPIATNINSVIEDGYNIITKMNL